MGSCPNSIMVFFGGKIFFKSVWILGESRFNNGFFIFFGIIAVSFIFDCGMDYILPLVRFLFFESQIGSFFI